MKIVVCVKQIQNPEIPPVQFRIDEEAKVLIPVSGLSPVLSPYDEQAIEAALRIRDRAGKDSDIEITIVTIASKGARAVIKAALALGADNAVLLNEPTFDGSGGYVPARHLAATTCAPGVVYLFLPRLLSPPCAAGVLRLGSADSLDISATTFASHSQITASVLTA